LYDFKSKSILLNWPKCTSVIPHHLLFEMFKLIFWWGAPHLSRDSVCELLCFITLILGNRYSPGISLANQESKKKATICFDFWVVFLFFYLYCRHTASPPITPPPNVMYSRNWYAFSVLGLTKFPPPYGEGVTFYYTRHDMNRFIPHFHRERPLNGFGNGPNLAENRIEYVFLTTWDGNSIFFSANRARPGSQKLPSNGFTDWSFLRNK